MPYDDRMTAMSAILGGAPRRRPRMGPIPGDLVDLPGSIPDPRLPLRGRRPGRRQQGLIPMVPPFTSPTGPGFTDPTAVGPGRRGPRRRQAPYPIDLTPQPTVPQLPMPTMPQPTMPQFPVITPQFPTNPGTTGIGMSPMGAIDLFGRGGFGYGG